MPLPVFDVEFTRSGAVFNPAQVDTLLNGLDGLTDLFVMSHGWNNDMAEARALYDELSTSLEDVRDAIFEDLNERSFGELRIFWPSKKFADEDLIPGGGAASATSENDEALQQQLEELKNDPIRLGQRDQDPARATALSNAQALIPRLQSEPAARAEYVSLLRSILNPSDAHADDGSEEFFTADPESLFASLSPPVNAPGPTHTVGGATDLRRQGAASGLGDLLSGVKAAARRLANFTTYYTMKERAGTVGREGLGPLLQRIRQQESTLRLHLIGHSFGGRLVTTAANTLAPATPAITLTLLQAAYSHNGLAGNFDQAGHDGAFHSVLSERRISGPIIITHTRNDKAVGIAYPLASRLARDAAAALGDAKDPYGGMGRNGAQHTAEAEGHFGDLLEVGGTYAFAPGGVFNLNADNVIHDHGDVRGQQVACAILNAARTI